MSTKNGTRSQNERENKITTGFCAYEGCNKRSSLSCPVCSKLLSCSRKHLKLCTTLHLEECVSFKPKFTGEFGRHMIATKDLLPSVDGRQVALMEERPKIFVPYLFNNIHLKNKKMCIKCCVSWDSSSSPETLLACESCKWPICKGPCAVSSPSEVLQLHVKAECEYLKTINLIDTPISHAYDCLLLHRLLSMKETTYGKDASIYNWILENLGEYTPIIDGSMEKEKWEVMLDIVRNNFKINARSISDEEVIRWLNLVPRKFLDTDRLESVVLREEDEGVRFGRGLYEFGSSIVHSCLPNCSFYFNGGKLTTYVAAPIKKGDILTASFDLDILMMPTNLRRKAIQDRFLFSCRCTRCTDPTELETFFSGIPCTENQLCRESNEAFILPLDTSDAQCLWTCIKCKEQRLDASLVEQFVEEKRDKLSTAGSYSDLNDALKKQVNERKALHWNHHLVFETSLRIMTGLCDKIKTIDWKVNKERQLFVDELKKYKEAAQSVNNITATFFPNFNYLQTIAECRMAALIQTEGIADIFEFGVMDLMDTEYQMAKVYFKDNDGECLSKFLLQKQHRLTNCQEGFQWLEDRVMQKLCKGIQSQYGSPLEFVEYMQITPQLLGLVRKFLPYKLASKTDKKIEDNIPKLLQSSNYY